MTDTVIIKNAMKFLTSDYGFIFEYNTNGKEDFYSFKNDYGSFNYYEWAQFGDFNFSVAYGDSNMIINIFEWYPKIVATYHKKNKGLKGFFKDTRKDYWEMIASIVKLEIETKGSLFGLRI